MDKKRITVLLIGVILLISWTDIKTVVQKHIIIDKNEILKDTIKRNDFVVYNITKDTIIGEYRISVNNKNIEDKYVIQYFKLDDKTVIANYYPEMVSTISILKHKKDWFIKTILKVNLPPNSQEKWRNKSVLKTLVFSEYDKEKNTFLFKATLSIPNTDFEYDYEIKVLPNQKTQIKWIDYEAE